MTPAARLSAAIELIDTIDAQNLWSDTAVIVCTDHGHYLGEKDVWGKTTEPEYLEKYRDQIARIGMTPETFAQRYSVPVRIRLTRLRGR